MKWLTLLVGALIIIAGAWLLLSPQDANGPEAEVPAFDEPLDGEEGSMEESGGAEHDGGAMMEDGTMEKKDGDAMEKKDDAMMEEGDAMKKEEPVGEATFDNFVTYTADGFDPKTVTIKKGQTIRFINRASNRMWVAGDNHPTHTIYPEKSSNDCLGTSFDACTSISAPGFWEFTFNSVGSWDYHNHVRSSDGGTIVVQ